MRSSHDLKVKQRLPRECVRAHTHTHTHPRGEAGMEDSLRSHYRKKGSRGTGKRAWVNGTRRQVFYRKDGVLIIKRTVRLSREEEDEALQTQEVGLSPGVGGPAGNICLRKWARG